MLSQKFYHSKSSPYPARLTDDYNFHHHQSSSSSSSHNEMYRGSGGSSNRQYSSSNSSKYYNSEAKSMQRMSSSSANGSNNKFDLRHQLNKNYYASQHEDRQRSANNNDNAPEPDNQSDSEDSRKSSRISPMNDTTRQRSQQRSIPHASKSSGSANRVDGPKSIDQL